jgi:hypothetical protein
VKYVTLPDGKHYLWRASNSRPNDELPSRPSSSFTRTAGPRANKMPPADTPSQRCFPSISRRQPAAFFFGVTAIPSIITVTVDTRARQSRATGADIGGWSVHSGVVSRRSATTPICRKSDTERHLLYVACTRARDHLLVTGVAPVSEFLDDFMKGDRGRALHG